MRINFYGTGASEGFPSMFCDCKHCRKARKLGGKNIRTRSSCGVDDELLIDFSGDSYAHTVYGGLDMRKVRHVLITHNHMDHFMPEDMMTIAPPCAYRKINVPLKIYGSRDVGDNLAHAREKSRASEQHIQFVEAVDNVPMMIGAYKVTPIKTIHDPATDCFIYLVEHNGKALLYGHDSAPFSEHVWQVISDYKLDCVVLDCTCVLHTRTFDNHMCFADNTAIRSRMLQNGIATCTTSFIATHFYHNYAPLDDQITPIMQREGFIAAYDGLQVSF